MRSLRARQARRKWAKLGPPRSGRPVKGAGFRRGSCTGHRPARRPAPRRHPSQGDHDGSKSCCQAPMRYLEKPREFDRLPLVALRSLLILSASSVSLCLGVPAQAQSAVPLAAVEPPPVVRTIGTDGTDIAAPTPPPPDLLLPDVEIGK